MTDQTKSIELPIDKCFLIFDQSVQRLIYFLCIVNNTTPDVFPDEWNFQSDAGISYKFHAPSKEQHSYLISGYRHFLHSYLVRDCIESFALSIDKMFLVLLVSGKTIHNQKSFHELLSEDEKKDLRTFEFDGLSNKMKTLKRKYGIDIKEKEAVLSSLKSIRDCLSHNNGFVREKDGEAARGGKRRFIWQTISIILIGEESGKEHPLLIGEPLAEPSTVCARLETHRKTFSLGEQIKFKSSEAYEIVRTLQIIKQDVFEEINRKLLIVNR